MKKSIIKLMPIGGQAENGKSMYCLEIDDNWFIIDAGYRFPEVDKLGVDVIIPNFDYLKDNKDKIKAIFITHGHDDVMGALPYLLQEVNVPIYTTDLTADLIDQLLQRYMRHSHVSYKYKIKRVNMNATIKVAGVEVDFFPITHSIPGSVGLAFLTDYGYIVYSSEFIIDFGAPERFRCNIQKMMEIGKKVKELSIANSMVIDIEKKGFMQFGIAKELANVMNATYYSVETLRKESILQMVESVREAK